MRTKIRRIFVPKRIFNKLGMLAICGYLPVFTLKPSLLVIPSLIKGLSYQVRSQLS